VKSSTTCDCERRGIVAGVMILAVAAGLVAAGTAAARPADADALLTHGRDTYGEAPSPLIASALDRATLQLGEATGIEGIRDHDRMLTGANPMHDQNLYQVLYALSERTGEKRYADDGPPTALGPRARAPRQAQPGLQRPVADAAQVSTAPALAV